MNIVNPKPSIKEVQSKMNRTKRPFAAATMTMLMVSVLSGCGGDDTTDTEAANNLTSSGNGNTAAGITTLQFDATGGGRGAAPTDPANKYTYLNLETGAVVNLTDAAAASSNDWHVAFKRTATKLNGGVSGSGTVRGAMADTQEEFYLANGEADTSVFLNATADTELTSLQAVSDVTALTFSSDRHIAAMTGDGGIKSWWSYNPAVHSVEAAADNWWLVKSAAGNSYAKVHVTNIVQTSRDITLELFIQDVGSSNFSTVATTYTAAIGAAGGSKCYDIDTVSEVDCTTAAANWDLKVEVSSDGRDWNIWSNGGSSGSGDGAVFGTVDAADIAAYPSGTHHSNGMNISSLYKSDSAGGLFADNSWYAYSLQGNNKLWPNYRVYAIDTGSAQYALQVLSFYDATGTSGMLKVRYKAL